MSAERLEIPPTSGEYDELMFDAYGTCTWVKFTASDQSEWCGSFGGGSNSHCRVEFSESAGIAFVLSLGQGYLIDISSRELLFKTKKDYLCDVRIRPNTSQVVVCDYTNIYLISDGEVTWDSGRVSFDGIKFGDVTEEKLTGTVNDLSDDWPEFVLNLREHKYKCSWACPV